MATKQLKGGKTTAAPANKDGAEDITTLRAVVPPAASVGNKFVVKLKGFIEAIFNAEKAVQKGIRGFATTLNEMFSTMPAVPAAWWDIECEKNVTPEQKLVNPYRTMFMDAYVANGKTRNAGRQSWSNVVTYAHEAADPVWAAAEKAKEEAAKVEAAKTGAHANTPKEPTARILADVFPVYKMLFKAESLKKSEAEAMAHLRDALKCIGAPLADFEAGK